MTLPGLAETVRVHGLRTGYQMRSEDIFDKVYKKAIMEAVAAKEGVDLPSDALMGDDSVMLQQNEEVGE